MSLHTHLATLQEKHTKLERMIGDEAHRPLPDFGMVSLLKKQKLLLKEEMERVRLLKRDQFDVA